MPTAEHCQCLCAPNVSKHFKFIRSSTNTYFFPMPTAEHAVRQDPDLLPGLQHGGLPGHGHGHAGQRGPGNPRLLHPG